MLSSPTFLSNSSTLPSILEAVAPISGGGAAASVEAAFALPNILFICGVVHLILIHFNKYSRKGCSYRNKCEGVKDGTAIHGCIWEGFIDVALSSHMRS